MGILLDVSCGKDGLWICPWFEVCLRLPLQWVFIIIFFACSGLYFEINGDVCSVTDEYKEEEFNLLWNILDLYNQSL
jgi:hypothetical protein